MFTSIAYKEWLKIRWTYLAVIVISAGVLTSIFLDMSYQMRMDRAISVWSYVVLMQYPFYDTLRYIPLLVGCAVALAQFIPEVIQSRLKLSLHLPLSENRVMLWMVAYGAGMVALVFLALAVASMVGTLVFFPVEVMFSAILTSAPWFLTGLAGYFITALIVVEPRWVRRALYLLVGYLFLDALLLRVGVEAYRPSLMAFLLLAALIVPVITLSGFRFRKGVR